MTNDEVMARLERLERQNRWLKGAGAALMVLVGAGVLMGMAPPPPEGAGKTVTATSFVLVDAHGTKRGQFACQESGTPELILFASNGQHRVSLDGLDVGGALNILGEGEARGVGLGVGGGEVSMSMTDEHGASRVWLALTDHEGAHMALRDAEGKDTFKKP